MAQIPISLRPLPSQPTIIPKYPPLTLDSETGMPIKYPHIDTTLLHSRLGLGGSSRKRGRRREPYTRDNRTALLWPIALFSTYIVNTKSQYSHVGGPGIRRIRHHAESVIFEYQNLLRQALIRNRVFFYQPMDLVGVWRILYENCIGIVCICAEMYRVFVCERFWTKIWYKNKLTKLVQNTKLKICEFRMILHLVKTKSPKLNYSNIWYLTKFGARSNRKYENILLDQNPYNTK